MGEEGHLPTEGAACGKAWRQDGLEEGRNALSISFVKIFLLNQKKKDTVYMISVNHGYFDLHFNTLMVLFTPLYKY